MPLRERARSSLHDRVARVQPSRWSAGDTLVAVLVALASVASWIPRARGPLDLRWDAAIYYVLGTSLAEGRGYRLLNEPGAIHALQYPPGLPAIIALHQRLLGTSDPVVVGLAMRETWIVLAVLFAVSTFVLGRIFLPRWYAAALALVCLLDYDLFFLSTLLFAELPFALCTTLFAIVYYTARPGARREGVTGALGIAAFLLRTIGIALLAAWVGDALLHRRFRTAVIRAVVAAVPVLLWQGYVRHVQASVEYRHPAYAWQRDPSQFYNVSYATNVALRDPFDPDRGTASPREVLARMGGNVAQLPRSIAEIETVRLDTWSHDLSRAIGNGDDAWRVARIILLVLWGVAFLTILGMALQLVRRRWAIGLYVVLTLAAICTTPWLTQFRRYLAPLAPFLLLCLLDMTWTLTVFARARYARLAAMRLDAVAAAGVCLFCVALASVPYWPPESGLLDRVTYRGADGKVHDYRAVIYPASYSALAAAAHWLGRCTPPSAVAIAQQPAWVYLQSGRPTVMWPFQRDSTVVDRLISNGPADYIVVEHHPLDLVQNPAMVEFVSTSPAWRRMVAFDSGEVEVFARRAAQPARCAADTAARS